MIDLRHSEALVSAIRISGICEHMYAYLILAM